jgi:ATP-dependent Clp protease ATP-binding subunit ClpC
MREDWPAALRVAFEAAEAESRGMRHGYIGSEHVLLGLLHGSGTLALAHLEAAGIGYSDARRVVVRIVGLGDDEHGPNTLPWTPNAAHVFRRVLGEAEHVGPDQIGSEHVLRAVLRRRGCLATYIVSDLDADPSAVADALRRPRPDSP